MLIVCVSNDLTGLPQLGGGSKSWYILCLIIRPQVFSQTLEHWNSKNEIDEDAEEEG